MRSTAAVYGWTGEEKCSLQRVSGDFRLMYDKCDAACRLAMMGHKEVVGQGWPAGYSEEAIAARLSVMAQRHGS